MDPLSISTSIIALFQLTSNILSFLSSVRNASSEQKELRNEVISVIGLLKMLEMRLVGMKADDEGFLTIRALAESSVLDRCKENLEELIGKTDNDTVSGLEKFGRKFTWHFEKLVVNKTLISVERLKSLLDLALMNDVGVLTQKIKVDLEMLIREVAEIKDGLEHQKIDKECQVVGDWLSPFDFNAIQQEILNRCHAGTGKWMLESYEFQQWSSGHNETLWCPGIPGAGKTYLASIVIDYLQRRTSSEGLNAVLCLFCNFNAPANQTAYNFMGALLKQLARVSRTLPRGIKEIYDKRENVRELDFKVLANAFRTELEKYTKTFIVIDALDEVPESADIRTMLLEELRSCPVNLLVTSRHDPNIRRQFSEAQHYEIHATDEDIRSYVSGRMALENRLSRLIRSVPSLEDDIPARIVGSAKGMFILARFHMDEIFDKTKPRHIEEALERLPQGLNDNYTRTIDRIKSRGSDNWDLARKVLLWLSNSLEPLSIGALREAVAVEPGMRSIGIRDLDDIESLISACAGLVVLGGGKETSAPSLVHYTLQEYLNKNQDILSPNPHAEVARACLAFLSFDDFSNKTPELWLRQQLLYGYETPRDKAFIDSPYHFTFYAVLSWGFHAQRAGETVEVMVAAIDFLSRPTNVAYNWVVIMIAEPWTRLGKWVCGVDPKLMLYEDLLKDADLFRLLLPVHFGLKGFLVELLKRHTRPAENALDTVISRLACHAARRGYEEIVRLLLTQKDVDWDMCDSSGENLLLLVDEVTLRTLLQKENCSVNVTNDDGSALHAAVTDWEPSRVRILLESGADVRGRNKYGEPVIVKVMSSRSFGESEREMMDLLLEYKADINAHTPNGSTALHLAVRTPAFGYKVEYLVSKGANLNLPDALGKTALDIVEDSAAGKHTRRSDSDYDHEMVIQILREAGGKTAKEMSQPSVNEQDPSFPPEWLERLKDIQELESSIDLSK